MRLLLIEDDTQLGESIQVSLGRQGYTVDWLQQGGQALAALKENDFSAVILDLTLPDIDGLEVLRQTREQSINTPILILTARDSLDDRIKGLDLGADDYLTKPFAVAELLARIRAISRRNQPIEKPIITLGELTINCSSNQVYYADKAIKLTQNEFKLLLAMAKKAGTVMSKDQLQSILHGWGEGTGENAIEVHIYNLRKKLSNKLIKNIRGIGYIIET